LLWPLFVRGRQRLRTAIFIIGIGVTVGSVVIYLVERFDYGQAVMDRFESIIDAMSDKDPGADRSLEERRRLYAGGWEAFKGSPVTGIGIGNFGTRVAAKEVGLEESGDSALLQIFVEQGVVCGAPWCFLGFWLVLRLKKISKMEKKNDGRLGALTLALVWMVLVFSLFLPNEVEPASYLVLGVGLSKGVGLNV
jgi:O-antigen ligase